MEGGRQLAHGIPTRLTPAEGRSFAFTVGGAFLAISAVLWWRGHAVPMAATAALGGVLLLAGLLVPGRLSGVHRAWMGLALLLSKVTTPVFMGLMFFLVLTPAGVLRRTFGRSPIRRPATAADGHWVRRSLPASRSMERQY